MFFALRDQYLAGETPDELTKVRKIEEAPLAFAGMSDVPAWDVCLTNFLIGERVCEADTFHSCEVRQPAPVFSTKAKAASNASQGNQNPNTNAANNDTAAGNLED